MVGCLGPLLVRTADYGREADFTAVERLGGRVCVEALWV